MKTRTTLTLDDDVAARLEQLKREGKGSFRDVVNAALRAGLGSMALPEALEKADYVIDPVSLGPKVRNLDDVAEAMAIYEGEEHR